ncbi:hypothetical protein STIAU_7193 [Stigmatella aurantiaca DW4/3-1]|uniref:Uncharacterized protein n=1 Tax=Stigmatella aurantiaca (strain DW4/3-1) TaxID=378806 RepID=Q08ST6_STIAD|nr:hypothetical protein STIAU_7193 [Stigmatella aurantiaca DW4/3-1]
MAGPEACSGGHRLLLTWESTFPRSRHAHPLHRGARGIPQDCPCLGREGADAARTGVGPGGYLPARDLQTGGRSGFPGHQPRSQVRRQWPGLLVRDGVLRGAVAQPERGREHGAAGAGPDGHAHHQRDRHGRAEARVPGARAQGREDRRAGRERAGGGLGRGQHEDDGAHRRRRLRHQRLEDVDHQRHPGGLHHAGGAHGRGRLRGHLPGDVPHGREGLLGVQEARQGGQPLLGHGHPLLRGLPHPPALRAGRGERGLLLHHDQLPGRAAGDRAHGGGGHGAHGGGRAALWHRAGGLRQAAAQVPGVAPQVRRAPHRHRGRQAAHVPRGGGLRSEGERGEGDLHGEALRGRSGAARGLRLPAVLRGHGLHRGDAHRPGMAGHPPHHHRRRDLRGDEGDPLEDLQLLDQAGGEQSPTGALVTAPIRGRCTSRCTRNPNSKWHRHTRSCTARPCRSWPRWWGTPRSWDSHRPSPRPLLRRRLPGRPAAQRGWTRAPGTARTRRCLHNLPSRG